MIDSIKNLNEGDMISLDSAKIRNFTNQEDFSVNETNVYELDAGELVMVKLDNHFLAAHDLSGYVRYFLYELHDVERQLRKCGRQIKLDFGNRRIAYTKNEEYQTTDHTETMIYEYTSKSYCNALLVKVCDEEAEIYRGFEINEKDIVI